MIEQAMRVFKRRSRHYALEIDERERTTAALAQRNAELHAELERRLTESESFSQVLVSLLRKTALEQVLDLVCAQAQGLIGATGSAVLLLLSDGTWLEVRHQLGSPSAAMTPVPVSGSLAGEVVRRGEPVLVNDMAVFDRSQVRQWPAELTALLTVPLHVDGRVIGVFDVVNKAGGFTEEDIPVMSVFANQAAMAIEHARLQRQAEQLAVLGERERLARELHDSVTQSLYSVTLYANAATLALAAGKTDATGGYLQELQETAQEGMRDMRLLIFQLHPPETGNRRAGRGLAGPARRGRNASRFADGVPRGGGAALTHRGRGGPLLDRPGGAQ